MAAGLALAQSPAPPIVTSRAWFDWYGDLLSSRLAACPLDRPTTFHFSQAGDDSAGDGSRQNPWRSLAKARQILDLHPAGDLALLFRRGDTWREDQGISAAAPNVTIADYGDPAAPKPLFTAFEPVGDAAAWSPTPGAANVYQRADPGPLHWVKEDDDLDRPYSKQSTVAGVDATEGSFFYDVQGAVLYIHPRHTAGGPTDPRTDGKPYELVRERHRGAAIQGDGSRLQNISAQGWGMTAGQVTQEHGIESRAAGGDRVAIVGCESHYGMTHAMTHWSAFGGRATFVDCKAGLTRFMLGSGGAVFNTYAIEGGQFTIWDRCVATHGALPADDHPGRAGTAFYGHTNGSPSQWPDMIVANGCTVRDTPLGCADSSAFGDLYVASDLAQVRCFIINETYEGGSGEGLQLGIANAARVNGRYLNIRPGPGGARALAGSKSGGWVINCTVQIDCAGTDGDFALFNATDFQYSVVRFWHCEFRIATRAGAQFRFDYDRPSRAQGSEVLDSIICNTGPGSLRPNLPPRGVLRTARGYSPGALAGNAYLNVDPAEIGTDPQPVVLTSVPGAVPSCASPLACAALPLIRGVSLAYDQSGRYTTRNDIGPLESLPCANCDESTSVPVLNVVDFACFLNRFASGDAAANCDGSTATPTLTIADFACFLNSFARGCE